MSDIQQPAPGTPITSGPIPNVYGPPRLPVVSDGISATITASGPYVGALMTCTPDPAFAGTPTFQWYRDGVAIGGATSNTHTSTAMGTYTCRVGGLVITSNVTTIS